LLHVSGTSNHHQADISVHGHDMSCPRTEILVTETRINFTLSNILLCFDWTKHVSTLHYWIYCCVLTERNMYQLYIIEYIVVFW